MQPAVFCTLGGSGKDMHVAFSEGIPLFFSCHACRGKHKAIGLTPSETAIPSTAARGGGGGGTRGVVGLSEAVATLLSLQRVLGFVGSHDLTAGHCHWRRHGCRLSEAS